MSQLLVIRHNMPYATKVFDVLVELMGIARSEEEAMDVILDEVNDYIKNYLNADEDDLFPDSRAKKMTDFERNGDHSLTLVFEDNEIAYDIIPVSLGFPDKYITLAGA